MYLSTATVVVLSLLLHAASVFPWNAVAAEDSATVNRDLNSVQFVVGNYLKSEDGNWDPAESPLQGPFGIDFDASGAMYIIELESGRLHQRLPSGAMQTLRRAHRKDFLGDGGPLSMAHFNGPHNCVVTADQKLLIADSWNHCVRSVDLESRQVETIAGNGQEGFAGDGGTAKEARFNYVMCIELDPLKKTLHLADLKNRRVRNLDLLTGIIQTVAGDGTRGTPENGSDATLAPLEDPRAVASDADGNLYILERNANCLRVIRRDGTIHTVAGSGERGWRDGQGSEAKFSAPKHICCDPAGNVFIADDTNRAVRKYDPKNGVVTTVLGRGFGDPRITLDHPHGVRWHDGALYVVDTGNHRIIRLGG
jgi:sugar lactone lactonase YvrE